MTSTVWKASWRYGENVFGKKSDLVHMTAVKLDHDLTNQSVEIQSLNL